MKLNLNYIKLYEEFGEELFIVLSPKEYHDFIDTHEEVLFTKQEQQLFRDKGFYYTGDYLNYLLHFEKQIKITKYIDEWYLVSIMNYIYLCDSIEGVNQFLKNEFGI